MIRIEIRNAACRHVSGISTKGKAYNFYVQEGYAFTADKEGNARPYPQQVSFNHDGPDKAYQPGVYSLAPASIWVDKFGSMQLAPRLVALPASGK